MAALPAIATDLGDCSAYDLSSPFYEVDGYDYDPSLQPYLIELWTEKSGDDATLAPLARRLGINYIPGIGFQSIASMRAMLRRVRRAERPGRILYVSDFDPAGSSMPISVGRHTQYTFWQLKALVEVETPGIALDPVALTYEQVVELELPRKPIKEEDLRKDNWEERFGEGAVEVDALEARYPGTLAHIVEERVRELQDTTLHDRMDVARGEAERAVGGAVREVVDEHRPEVDAILEEFAAVADRYRERLRAISEDFESEGGPLRERLSRKQREVAEDLDDLDVNLPEMPSGVAPDVTSANWMFDSERGFLEQTKAFRIRQRRSDP